MNAVLSILARVIISVIKLASPQLVADLKAFVVEFRDRASRTDNPLDAVLAEALCGLLGIE